MKNKSLREDIVDFVLNDTVTLDRLNNNSIFGTLLSMKGVERMTLLKDKQHWMAFLADPHEYKVITYICNYHHSYHKIKIPNVEPPWSCMEEFIQYCERTNVEPDQINHMIKILSKGFPVYLLDIKSLI